MERRNQLKYIYKSIRLQNQIPIKRIFLNRESNGNGLDRLVIKNNPHQLKDNGSLMRDYGVYILLYHLIDTKPLNHS